MTAPLVADDLPTLHRLLAGRTPVMRIVWQGRPAWAKRCMRARWHERALLALAPLLRRWLAPQASFRPVRRDAALPVEAQRLAELHRAGCGVPRLIAVDRELLVVEDCGRNLEHLVQDEPQPPLRLQWLREAAADLGRFHAAGQWHGGAQLRNLLRRDDGSLARIDFETALDAHFPLPVLQAIDAALFFTSVARFGDAAPAAEVAPAYLQFAPEAARAVLRRGAPLLGTLARSRLLQRLAPKEAARLRGVAAVVPLL